MSSIATTVPRIANTKDELLLPAFTLWWREVVRFYRQRTRVVGVIASPVLFWLVIGSGFGDIFFANCFQNGILPIIVDKEIVDSLAADVQQTQGAGRISIDLQQQTIISPSGQRHEFAIDPRRRTGLLEGLDEVALTLQRDDEIRAFQAADRAERPWIHFARTTAGNAA